MWKFSACFSPKLKVPSSTIRNEEKPQRNLELEWPDYDKIQKFLFFFHNVRLKNVLVSKLSDKWSQNHSCFMIEIHSLRNSISTSIHSWFNIQFFFTIFLITFKHLILHSSIFTSFFIYQLILFWDKLA